MRGKISGGSERGKNFDDYLGEKNFGCVKKGEICRDGVYIYIGGEVWVVVTWVFGLRIRIDAIW